MLVISDASPINVLIRIELIHILPSLYERVVIPTAVFAELSDPSAPQQIRTFMSKLPSWLEIRKPEINLMLFGLGAGERAAISLAKESNAQLLLVDDKRGRRAALRLGIPIVGTLGLLELASSQNLIDFTTAITQLRGTDFKISERLIEQAIKRMSPDRTGPNSSGGGDGRT